MISEASGDKLTSMSQPFQFSLGRLMAAIALFALSLWLLRVARDSPENGAAATAAFPLLLGSAIGSLFGRAGVGATATVVLYCLLGWLMVRLENDPVINGRRRGIFERRRFSVVSAHEYESTRSQAWRNKSMQTMEMAVSPSGSSVQVMFEPTAVPDGLPLPATPLSDDRPPDPSSR
jgi:hypothetical protein